MTIIHKLPLTLKIYFYEHVCQNITFLPQQYIQYLRLLYWLKVNPIQCFEGKRKNT